MGEILASQKMMLRRTGRDGEDESDEKMTIYYERHIKKVKYKLEKRKDTDVLFVSYNDTIRSPRRISKKICHFVERNLNIERMVEIADPTLYRQRQLG